MTVITALEQENLLLKVLESKIWLDSAKLDLAPEEVEILQTAHDDLFEAMSLLHDNDPEKIQQTAKRIADRRKKK